jgi:nicotinate-nucleotide adenylyltransferase
MVLRALKNEPAFAVSSVEVEREGPSYTIDTLSALAKLHTGAEIFFITGIDSFRDIQTWCRWEELLRSYAFIVHDRPGTDLETAYDSVPERVHSLMVEVSNDPVQREGGRGIVYLLRALTLDISSTEVREMVRAGRSIRYLVPAEVEAYIQENRLYREGD